MEKHKWIVYSTAVGTGVILCKCERCKVNGVVRDPSEDEWTTAYFAPSDPYEWKGKYERVQTNKTCQGKKNE